VKEINVGIHCFIVRRYAGYSYNILLLEPGDELSNAVGEACVVIWEGFIVYINTIKVVVCYNGFKGGEGIGDPRGG